MSTTPPPLFDPTQLPLRQAPRPLPMALSVANGAPEQQPQNPAVAPIAKPTGQTSTIPQAAFGQEAKPQGSAISRIHNPFLKGLATVGDVIAGTFAPRAEQLIPGTEGNYNMRMARAGNLATTQSELQNAATRRGLEEAQTEEARAKANPSTKTATNEMERYFQLNPNATVADWRQYQIDHPEKTEKSATPHIEKGDDGTIYSITFDPASGNATPKVLIKGNGKHPQLTAEERGYMKNAGGDPDKEETWTPEVMAKYQQMKAGTKAGDDFSQFYAKWLKEKGLTDSATNEAKARSVWAASGQAPERPPQPPVVFAPGPNGTVIPTLPKLGVPLASGIQSMAGVNAVNTPTTQMRNVGAQAQLVHSETPRMLSEIDRLKDKLGPLAGRWNEFMQGKVGTNDPDFAGLRTDLLMYSSAVALMHARGRLPENLREEFDRTINNPHQNFDNLKAAIGRIDEWTARNMETMEGPRQQPASTPQPTGGGQLIEYIRDASGKLVRK